MKSIGEVYFDSSYFIDEESKTIGQPLIGENIETIFKNRRGAKGKLNEVGRKILEHISQNVSSVIGSSVKMTWDKHCGCSMCPCSPGYRVKTDIPFKSKDDTRFNIFINNDGSIEYRTPKRYFELGHSVHEELRNKFSN
jgi:hypothetical protein